MRSQRGLVPFHRLQRFSLSGESDLYVLGGHQLACIHHDVGERITLAGHGRESTLRMQYWRERGALEPDVFDHANPNIGLQCVRSAKQCAAPTTFNIDYVKVTQP